MNKTELENYFYSAGLKKILGIKKENKIIKYTFVSKNHLFIIINSDLRINSFINNNKELFIKKLEGFLYLYNLENKYFNNIGVNRTEINNIIYGNTIILANIKQKIAGFIKLKDLGLKINENGRLEDFYLLNKINIPKKEKRITTSKKTGLFYKIIIKLLEDEKFSVRKLREEGINTQKSLMINDYIKKLNIFEVDIYDNKKKIYFLDRLELIDINIINRL